MNLHGQINDQIHKHSILKGFFRILRGPQKPFYRFTTDYISKLDYWLGWSLTNLTVLVALIISKTKEHKTKKEQKRKAKKRFVCIVSFYLGSKKNYLHTF